MKISQKPKVQANPMQVLDNKLRKASQMYEEQFLRQMVKAMRGTVNHSSLTKPGMGERIYREQLDQQYVETWVDRGGTGFADMIYSDLVDKFYPHLKGHMEKKLRPLNLTDRFQGMVKRKNQPANRESFVVSLGEAKGKSYLQLPWQGKFEKEMKMPDGRQLVSFTHPYNLKSTFVFQGSLTPGLKQAGLIKGEKFAELMGKSQEMLWQIQKVDPPKAPVGAPEE